MLVLSRKLQEKIKIGDDIYIQILKTGPGAVRVGIEAPVDVPIVRDELNHESTEEEPKPQVA
ncbi:carbon storage regulator [Gimesia aquarii]|uniref:Translational regulator CsrA n=1 Tax=Gimesia aquarii TaxID=2527964 RepID=A0A517VYE1_9PLAN|nr:carbon storage regulator [Gimesia aquarii]QDT98011.1 hypothetical protein V144x_34950 [Gimesia aquarii]